MKTNILGLPVKESELISNRIKCIIGQFSSVLSKFKRISLEYSRKTFF